MVQTLQSVLGIAALLGIAFAFSEDKKAISWPVVLVSLGVQLFLALILLYMPGSQHIFLILNSLVMALEKATRAGTSFVFGYLGDTTTPFEVTNEISPCILAFWDRQAPAWLFKVCWLYPICRWRVKTFIQREPPT